MGQAADHGVAILTAATVVEVRQARALIDLSAEEPLGYGISPDDFGNLTLQIFAGKLCDSRNDAFDLIGSTLTAARERNRNRAGIEHWREQLFRHIDRLVDTGCLVELHGTISVTTFGIAVAHSGLKPETALTFINALRTAAPELINLVDPRSPPSAEDDLLFILVNAVLRSPEFTVVGGKPTRTVSWRVGRDGPVPNSYASRVTRYLFDQPWTSDAGAANGALQLAEWAGGKTRAQVERLVHGVRLGTVQTLARDAAWVLTGLSEIIFTVTSPTLAEESKPLALRGGGEAVAATRQLARTFRRLAMRLVAGLPGDILWMTELRPQGPHPRLRREQALALKRGGFTRPIDLMDGSEDADERRRVALGLLQRGGLANAIRTAARLWRQEDRLHSRTVHMRRSNRLGLGGQVAALYDDRGTPLEAAFEQALNGLAMPFRRLDDRSVLGHPDYIISIENFPPVVVEVKSKVSDEETVSLNSATEVLAASELAGLRESPCVTLCSPAVDPSVPGAIEAARRLCVVDLADFVEAVLRLHEGTLTRSGFYNWLTTPGIALAEGLPYPN
jgi:helicase